MTETVLTTSSSNAKFKSSQLFALEVDELINLLENSRDIWFIRNVIKTANNIGNVYLFSEEYSFVVNIPHTSKCFHYICMFKNGLYGYIKLKSS